MTSHAGGHKVAIIQPADAMNSNAANSLLKTLEEPTRNTVLILLTAMPGKLPATICSRCQQLRLVPPPLSVAQRWLESSGVPADVATRCLQMTGGAPLKALELAGSDLLELREQRLEELWRVFYGQLDPVPLAAQWMGKQESQTLQWWLRWLRDLISWQIGGRQPAEACVVDKLQKISESVDSRQICSLADAVTRAVNSIGSGLNRQLILEELLISWASMGGMGRNGNLAGNG
jgi:DNA polymerase-3 subunit delta'